MLAPFVRRHVGPSEIELKAMLATLGFSNLDELTRHTVPASIRFDQAFHIPAASSEHEALAQLKKKFSLNKTFRSYIGTGYSDTLTPTVILRNVLENPGWYTQYTPYQAEIAQGRLEALLNFQTLVSDLTGLGIANASLLDEGTAVAEAMHLAFAAKGETESKGTAKKNIFFVSELCHPQTVAVTRTRAEPLGIQVVVGDHTQFEFDASVFGAVFQYPASDGAVIDYSDVITQVKACDALAIVATDLLALTLLRSPGEMGADIAVGNSQRLGVPLGFGGPHAAFFATHELYKRQIPGLDRCR